MLGPFAQRLEPWTYKKQLMFGLAGFLSAVALIAIAALVLAR